MQNLIESARLGRHHTAWPIGFYFAKLWYYEKLYPLIYTVRALGHFHGPSPILMKDPSTLSTASPLETNTTENQRLQVAARRAT